MKDKRKSNFRGKVSEDAQRERRSSTGYLNLPKGVKTMVLDGEPKTVQLDILPYVVSDKRHPDRNDKKEVALPGDLWYKRPFFIHRQVGEDKITVVCPSSVGKPCPICDFQKVRFKAGAPISETKEYYPKPRFLYNVIPLGIKGVEETPHIWDMAESLFQDVLKEELADDPENEIFPDLEEGKTLEITFKWKSFGDGGNSFPEARKIRFLDRDPYKEKILDEVADLDTVLKILPYDELEAIFQCLPVDEEDDKKQERHHKREEEEEPKQESKHTERSRREEEETTKKPDLTWDELEEMSHRKLERLVEDRELKIRLKDYDDDPAALRKAIADKLDIDIPRKKPKVEDDDPKPAVHRAEKSDGRTPPQVKDHSVGAAERCPHGNVFGKDTDEYTECGRCKLWDDCIEAKEKANKK